MYIHITYLVLGRYVGVLRHILVLDAPNILGVINRWDSKTLKLHKILLCNNNVLKHGHLVI